MALCRSCLDNGMRPSRPSERRASELISDYAALQNGKWSTTLDLTNTGEEPFDLTVRERYANDP